MKLYELAIDYRKLDQIEDAEELKTALEKLGEDFKAKAISLGKFYKKINADIEAIDNEIKRLSDKKRVVTNKAEFIKTYLFDNMVAAGIKEIDDPIIKLVIRKNNPSCGEILDVEALPLQFRELQPSYWTAKKNDLLAHFKTTGEMVCPIITDKKHLEIK